MVTPLARHRPWKVAQEAATIDHLSEGRLILGVGVGDIADPTFARLGEETDLRRRAQMLDEALEVLTEAWTGQPFFYTGQFFQVHKEKHPATRCFSRELTLKHPESRHNLYGIDRLNAGSVTLQ